MDLIQQHRRILGWISVLAIVVILILEVPVSYGFGIKVSLWLKFGLFIITLFIFGKKWKLFGSRILNDVVVAVIVMMLIWSKDLSEGLFLGREIGHTHYAEAPAGREDIYLYSNGKCKITLEGAISFREVRYCRYRVEGNVAYINSELWEVGGLEAGGYILSEDK